MYKKDTGLGERIMTILFCMNYPFTVNCQIYLKHWV